MRVKLQPPSKVEMAAYNPVQPPASISQVMLLANPSKVCAFNCSVSLSLSLSLSLSHTHIHVQHYTRIHTPYIYTYVHTHIQVKIRLRYRISYNQGGQEVVDMGEASDFPAGL